MTWDILTDLLSSTAFPILACIALAWYVYHTTEQNNARIDALTEKVMQAINNNTQALTKLSERLEDDAK